MAPFWQVRDGAIVGTPVEGVQAHTFLYSQRTYADFDLRFKVRCLGGGNSGVQFRSQVVAAASCTVVGPQIEIADVDSRFPPGSALNEPNAVPGYPSNRDVVTSVWKKEDFNEMHIHCVGKTVQVTINGHVVLSTDYPSLPDAGVIAWQMHGRRTPQETTFKDIEFADLSRGGPALKVSAAASSATVALPNRAAAQGHANDGFVPLFNGRDLTGWKTHTDKAADWQVRNGI